MRRGRPATVTAVRPGSENRRAKFPLVERRWTYGFVVEIQDARRIDRLERNCRGQGRRMESASVAAVTANMGSRVASRRTVGCRHVTLVLTDAHIRQIVVSARHVRSDTPQEQRQHERHHARRIA